jgi:hypothetical protein
MNESTIKNICVGLVKFLFNPVSFITWFPLIVYNMTITFIRAQIGIPYGRSFAEINNDMNLPEGFKGIGRMLNDPYNYAMMDYSMQILMLLIASILAVNLLLGLSVQFKIYGLSVIGKEIYAHSYSFWFYLISIVVFVSLILAFISGYFAKSNIVLYYLPDDMVITGKSRLPPKSSPLTYARLIMGIYGFFLTLYFRKQHNELLRRLKANSISK